MRCARWNGLGRDFIEQHYQHGFQAIPQQPRPPSPLIQHIRQYIPPSPHLCVENFCLHRQEQTRACCSPGLRRCLATGSSRYQRRGTTCSALKSARYGKYYRVFDAALCHRKVQVVLRLLNGSTSQCGERSIHALLQRIFRGSFREFDTGRYRCLNFLFKLN